MDLPSTKPYLLRALYEWCGDNGFTPYVAVAVDETTLVPREHVRDGQIVLNISDSATSRLSIDNELISFVARFGGVAREIKVPIGRVAAIYAKENGAGMAFDVAAEGAARTAVESVSDESPEPSPPSKPTAHGRPKLQRIK
jgi:stringent starvation protein B